MGVDTYYPLPIWPKLIRAIWRGEGDIVIGITGNNNSGKTTLGLNLSYLTQSGLNPASLPPDWSFNNIKEEDFNLKTQVAYFGDQANSLFLYAPKRRVCLCDEITSYKRDAGSRESKWGNIIVDRMRFQERAYFLCGRRIGYFDKDLRESRIKLLFHCVAKGHAEIYQPLEKHEGDPWNLDEPELMLDENGVGYTTFPKIDDRIKNEYDKVKAQNWEELKTRYNEQANGKDKTKTKKGLLSAKQFGKGLIRLQVEVERLGSKITDKQLAEMFEVDYKQVTNAKSFA